MAQPVAGGGARPPQRHRGPFWTAVVLCVLALVLGLARAVSAYTATSGPGGVVGAYFAALQQGDAPAALAYGDVPDGTHLLLTSGALRQQQAIAPLAQVHVGPVHTSGAQASVQVHYRLAAPGVALPQAATVAVHDTSGGWRLDAVAVPVTLSASQSGQRMTLLGGVLPTTPLLAFPGVLPVHLDTAYLGVDPRSTAVTFGSDPRVTPDVVVTAAGRSAVTAAVQRAVQRCLSGAAGPAADLCPLPGERYVPGSVRGALSGPLRDVLITLLPTELGEVSVSAHAPVTATYRQLDFRNHTTSGRGTLTLQVHAITIAVAPITLAWTLA